MNVRIDARKDQSMSSSQYGFKSYDSNRMVVLFTIASDGIEVPCAISTEALDRLDGVSRVKEDQRESQFDRLHEKIEARAAEKFRDSELEGKPAGIILRSIDFRS
jgi:hypothetical protein